MLTKKLKFEISLNHKAALTVKKLAARLDGLLCNLFHFHENTVLGVHPT